VHEYHLVEGAVKMAIASAKENQAAKVSRVKLVVGEALGLEDSSLRLYFESLSQGTLLEGAELIIRHVAARLKCSKCGKEFERQDKGLECPACGGLGRPIDIGKDFCLEDIEIEK